MSNWDDEDDTGLDLDDEDVDLDDEVDDEVDDWGSSDDED